jgi:hypothetical protein
LFAFKDLILAAAAYMLVTSHEFNNKHFLDPKEVMIWRSWIFLFCAFAAISGISIQTIAGLRYYLAALPLVILLPHLLTGWNDLRRTVRISLYVGIAICMLGIVQYSSPTDAELNRYAWGQTSPGDVSSFGVADEDSLLGIDINRPRITGTFSYISTYVVYLQFMFLVAWAAVISSRSVGERSFALFCLLLLFVNIAMTGSRGPLLLSVILSVLRGIARKTRRWCHSSNRYRSGGGDWRPVPPFTIHLVWSFFATRVLEIRRCAYSSTLMPINTLEARAS